MNLRNDSGRQPTSHYPDEWAATASTAFLAIDWTRLQHGDRVWLRRRNQAPSAARVDGITPDGSILWVVSSGASTRKMIHRADGEEVWSLRQTADNAPSTSASVLSAASAGPLRGLAG